MVETSAAARLPALARRLPTRSECWLLYAAAAVPVHTWAALIFFHALPSYLLRLSLGNILVILAYVLLLALVESGLIAALVVGLGLILPDKLFSPYRPAQGIGLIWLAFIWLLPTHFQIAGPEPRFLNLPLLVWLAAVWWVSLGLALAGLYVGLRRRAGLAGWLTRIAEGFTLLAGVYVFFDLLALAAVVLRWFTRLI